MRVKSYNADEKIVNYMPLEFHIIKKGGRYCVYISALAINIKKMHFRLPAKKDYGKN